MVLLLFLLVGEKNESNNKTLIYTFLMSLKFYVPKGAIKSIDDHYITIDRYILLHIYEDEGSDNINYHEDTL